MNATAKPVRLSVLDQSPIIHGHTPAQAVQRTIELAREVESFGYHRMWLAEHHSMKGLADPCPEILLTRIASVTSRLRVGTGGVLLPYYSALKVAEQFRMLEALFPGRIDLGVGRAPGSDMVTSQALFQGAFYDINQFPAHVQETVAFLDDALPANHPYGRVKAMPAGPTSPEVWLLGSSDYSATLAAHLGLRCSFAHFINAHGGDEVMRAYRRDYRPSVREPAPYSMLTVFAICGRTTEEAERLAAPIDLRRLQMARGFDAPVATIEQALGPAVHRSRPHGHPPRTRAGDHRHAGVGSRSHPRIAIAVRSRRGDGAHDHRRLRRAHRVVCDAGGGFRALSHCPRT